MMSSTLKLVDFEWDEGNIFKVQRRFSIEEVEHFFHQNLLVKEDTRKSYSEKRYLAIGYSSFKKPMLVCFTFRGTKEDTKIRVISCRLMHKKEALNYEIFKKNFEKEI